MGLISGRVWLHLCEIRPKLKQRGGAHPGAGRKVANPAERRTVPIAANVPGRRVERLDSLVRLNGWNRPEAVTQAIRGLLSQRG